MKDEASNPMIRFYVLPVERVRIYSGPKYFTWRYDPDPPGIDCFWSRKDYGAAPACVLAADIDSESHNTLSTLRDVYPFPSAGSGQAPALDVELKTAERHKLAKVLARLRVPSSWPAEGISTRFAIRTLAAMFHYAQALTRIGGPFFEWGVQLDTRWHELTARQKDWIKEAAWTCGYNLDFLSVNTELQALLLGMAAQYGNKPVRFKITDV